MGVPLQGCRDTNSGNLGSIPYPSLRYLFGSGSAGLGRSGAGRVTSTSTSAHRLRYNPSITCYLRL
jgi:hypothetical protein